MKLSLCVDFTFVSYGQTTRKCYNQSEVETIPYFDNQTSFTANSNFGDYNKYLELMSFNNEIYIPLIDSTVTFVV